MSELDSDGVGVIVLYRTFFDTQLSRHHAPFDRVSATFRNSIKEETFNAAFMQHDLLEPTNARDSIKDAIASLYDAIIVRVPETYLEPVRSDDTAACATY